MADGNRLAILGASGHGKVVADAALLSGWRLITLFDDAFPEVSSVGPWPVAGATPDLLARHRDFDAAVVAIGDNRARLKRQRELAAGGLPLASVVHPAAVVSPYAEIGEGTVVFAGAVVNPFARLGRACIVNTGASVDHDCVLADAVHVGPGARLGGGVSVGESAWIGIGASVRQNLSIGALVIVGVGAAVVRDVPDEQIVVGVPAKPMKRRP